MAALEDLFDDIPLDALPAENDSSSHIPPLVSVSDSSEDEDESVWLSECNEEPQDLAVEDDRPAASTTVNITAATLTKAVKGGLVTELYDSGATRHMTPYRDLLENYMAIIPKSINAVNKHTFQAVGRGNLTAQVPNGGSATTIMLKDVLYAPDITVTLISVSRIDTTGYSALFEGGACTIRDRNQKVVGRILLYGGLYCVEHDKSVAGTAYTAREALTIMELHCCMGHITPKATKHLVNDGLVTGVDLDASSGVKSCDSCAYAKMTHKPVPRERAGERANKFGVEVHSDVWGPSPIKTMGGKAYYVSFTDDKTRHTQVHLLTHKATHLELT
jgi:hypothetical protein